MAVRARWCIGDVLRQVTAMNAGGVRPCHAGVAFGAGRRDSRARDVGGLNVVPPVTIHANRRRSIATLDRVGVHAVERATVVAEMALTALLRGRQCELPRRAPRAVWMRQLACVRMTVDAGGFASMYRLCQRGGIHARAALLRSEGQINRFSMTGQALVGCRTGSGRARRATLGDGGHDDQNGGRHRSPTQTDGISPSNAENSAAEGSDVQENGGETGLTTASAECLQQ